MTELTDACALPTANIARSQTKRRAISIDRASPPGQCTGSDAPSRLTPAVLAGATGLGLRTSTTALAVRLLTATAVYLRSRSALRVRSFLAGSHLRPRLPAATVEALLCRLRRRPRRRRHGAHLTLLRLRSAVHSATARVGLRWALIASNGHMRLLGAATSERVGLVAANRARGRPIAATASTGAPAGLDASPSPRRPIIAASHMRSRLSSLATVLTASAGTPAALDASASSRRPIASTACHIVVPEMRVPTVLRPATATARATTDLSASRSSGRPIVTAGYVPWTTTPRPTMLGSTCIRPPTRPAAVVRNVILLPTAAGRPTAPLTSTRRLNAVPSKHPRALGSSDTGPTLVHGRT
jgi:hypothetical protein